MADLPTQQGSGGASIPPKGEEDLIRKIREDFTYCKAYWRENHEESEKDMRCMAAIPPTDFTDDRKNRPAIWPDETSQYVKQANNNLRQNKRSIKISARGEGATDQDAEHRQAYIRGIEYASNAQSIYTTAFEACVACGFGFARITTCVTGPNGEQEPRLKRIPNQFTCYPDPDADESDFSDSMIYFVLTSMRVSTFARKYKNAAKRSFSPSDREQAADWFHGENIVVAEYWVREEEEDEDGVKHHTVTQYITNGLEILEKNEWIGSWIPIVGMFGEELYVRTAGESKRMFMSLIRRARPAQQMMAYIASQEAEEFQMAPRAPLMCFAGMMNPEDHGNLHLVAKAYTEVQIPLNWQPGWGAPPMPARAQFTPNIQVYEEAYQGWRQNLQAAMGISPLPTAAQRNNEKSGIALERINTQEAIGAYHFTDNFARFLGNAGRQIDELITKLAELDSLPKQLLGKDQKDEDMPLKVAAKDEPADSQHLEESDVFFAHRGEFEVTVSEGPAYQSQREEASSFADLLLQTAPSLGLPGPIIQHLLAIAVKLKNIGTYGDEIADLLAPPDPNNLSPQAKAILAQSQGQIQQLTQELQKAQFDLKAKIPQIQSQAHQKAMDHIADAAEGDKDRLTKLAIAEIETKAQNINERMSAYEDLMAQLHQQAHEIASQLTQHSHDRQQAQDAQAAAQQAQVSDQSHDAASQQVDQAHQASMAEQQQENQGAAE